MLNVVILAAGQGKRMYSDLPKVLHNIGGKPLLAHVTDAASSLSPTAIYVVYGHQGEVVRNHFPENTLHWVQQMEQKGTAHAVQQVLPLLQDNSVTLVLYGDVPLVSAATLHSLCSSLPENGVNLLVANVVNPQGLGRVLRDQQGNIIAIVEEKDATPEQRNINEIYSGIMAISTAKLRHWLAQIDNNNAQQEFYLTTIPALAIADGCKVQSIAAPNELEVLGVNNKIQLALLERCYQQQQVAALLEQGVTFRDPARCDIRGQLSVGRDVTIDINVIFEGQVKLGDGVSIGANSVIRNTNIGNQVTIKENCVIEDSIIESNCIVGPFARLRPATHLASHVHVGNFVEIKKSHIGSGTKVNHLTYIGDAEIGSRVNVGAGTITCNYDGVNKHKTQIGDNAFIGSNTSLVAPLTIGESATIGAGSTVTKSVPAHELTVSRAKQVLIPNWQRPEKITQ